MSTRPILRLGTVKNVSGFQRASAVAGFVHAVRSEILTGRNLHASAFGQWRHQNRQSHRGPSHGGMGRTARRQPVEHTIRRWQRFGHSGAKLIWGGEAVAVSHEGRANPNQLVAAPQTERGFAQLRATLIEEHRLTTGSEDGLLIGLQLTRFGPLQPPQYARPPRAAHSLSSSDPGSAAEIARGLSRADATGRSRRSLRIFTERRSWPGGWASTLSI